MEMRKTDLTAWEDISLGLIGADYANALHSSKLKPGNAIAMPCLILHLVVYCSSEHHFILTDTILGLHLDSVPVSLYVCMQFMPHAHALKPGLQVRNTCHRQFYVRALGMKVAQKQHELRRSSMHSHQPPQHVQMPQGDSWTNTGVLAR